jgi:hypothetical protein
MPRYLKVLAARSIGLLASLSGAAQLPKSDETLGYVSCLEPASAVVKTKPELKTAELSYWTQTRPMAKRRDRGRSR